MALDVSETTDAARTGRKLTATTVLAAYLALSGVAAAVGLASGRTPAWLLAVHIAALALVGSAARVQGQHPVIDWLPIAAAPLLYAELPHILLGSSLHDNVVQGWEAAWFGPSPAHVAAARWPFAFMSELLHAAYLSYYAIIVMPPLVLYLSHRREEFERTVAGLIATFAVCFIIFIAFPVAGPRYAWSPPPGIFDGPVRRTVLRLLEAGSSRGTAFPSSHVAVAVAQSVMAFRWSRRFGIGVGVVTVLLALGAVYGGFHYAVDAIAGGLIGGAVGTVFSFGIPDEAATAHDVVVEWEASSTN